MKTRILLTIVSTFLAGSAFAANPPQCSGTNLHLSLATAGVQEFTTSATTGYGTVMFGISNPSTCVTQGVAYIVNDNDPSALNYYGWALVCVNVPGCAAGTVVATTGAVSGPVFSPNADHQASIPWLGPPVTIRPGMYGLVLGSTCNFSCASLFGDVVHGSWYPFVQGGTGTSGLYPWSFTSAGFGTFSAVPPTPTPPVLGSGAGIAPPAAILY